MQNQDECSGGDRNRGDSIAARIRHKRAQNGFSQAEAAEAWGLNKRTLQQWEQGARRPHGLYLAHIEKILAEATLVERLPRRLAHVGKVAKQRKPSQREAAGKRQRA